MNGSVVIVGGGVAGLVASLLLAKQGASVTLVESAAAVGGLLRSRYYPGLGSFDYGTHIPAETGLIELDDLIFEACYNDDWMQFSRMKAATFTCGKYTGSSSVDVRGLAEDSHRKACSEVLSLPPIAKDISFPSLYLRLMHTYGAELVDKVFRPAMLKLTGYPLEDLADNTHILFGMSRILMGSAKDTVRWKGESEWHDSRLGFQGSQSGLKEGQIPPRYFYPRSGGVGKWIDSLHDALRRHGASIKVGARVRHIDFNNGLARSLVLDTNEVVYFDRMVWTAPTAHLLTLLYGNSNNPEIMSLLKKPTFCDTVLVDLVLDRKPLTDDYYVTCYDPSIMTFRVTNYSAIQGEDEFSARYRVTAEILVHKNVNVNQVTADTIFLEMCKLGLFDPSVNVIGSNVTYMKDTFPVPTSQVVENNQVISETALKAISNLSIVGKGAGGHFFMKDVLVDAHQQLSS